VSDIYLFTDVFDLQSGLMLLVDVATIDRDFSSTCAEVQMSLLMRQQYTETSVVRVLKFRCLCWCGNNIPRLQ